MRETKLINGLVAVILVLSLLAAFATPLSNASTTIGAANATYGNLVQSFFANGGILYILLVIGVFLGLYQLFWKSGK